MYNMETTKFKVEVDPDIADLVPQFLENRKKDMLSLEELIESKNIYAISQLAHKIKGSAAGYGFEELSRIAAKMEEAAKQNDLFSIQKLFSDASKYLQDVEVIYPQ